MAWIVDKKRYSRFFKTEKEQEEFADTLIPFAGGEMSEILALDFHTQSEIIAVNKKRGDTSFVELWNFYQKHHKTREVLTLLQGADIYVRSLWQQELNKNYVTHARLIMERLCESLGDTLIEDIKRVDLEGWIAELPYAPVTMRNYRATIRAAWTFFERKDWIEKNIALALKIPKVVQGEIGIFTVEEAEQLLRANEKVDPEVCGLIALGLFAGMRTSAISRVNYDEINFEARGITTPAEKTKIQRRNYIENLPDNLWAWLERTPKSAFSWCERKWKKRREIALRRAGLLVNARDVKKAEAKETKAKLKIPPHNAMRHSFVSYHVAWKRNFQDTALIISHTSTDILFQHYRGVATKENAERYFNIFPAGNKKTKES